MITSQNHRFSRGGGNYLLGVAVAALFCAVSSARAENDWTYYAANASGNPTRAESGTRRASSRNGPRFDL